MKKNEVLVLEAFDTTLEGYGVTRHSDLVIFVRGLLKGEKARVKVIKTYKNYAIALIEELLVTSLKRVAPVCEYNLKCGGCCLGHLEYEEQLVLKKHYLESLLIKNGLDLAVKDTVASIPNLRFRNKIQVPVQNGKLGFYRAHSHDIVEAQDCKIQSKNAGAIIDFLRPHVINNLKLRHIIIKEAFKTGEIMVAFVSLAKEDEYLKTLALKLKDQFKMITSIIYSYKYQDDNVILGDEESILYGKDHIVDILEDLKFKISLKSFYQINPYVTPLLYEGALERIKDLESKNVLDLYSGIGTIALFAAKKAKSVLGVEIVKEAVLNAKENAKLNHIKNVDFVCEDAKDNLKKHLKGIDVVIVDPPRKGLHQDVVELLSKEGIKEIVYISCNPATLIRDIALFMERGYQADYLRGYDMFPHSKHIETLVVLSKLKTDKHTKVKLGMEEFDRN